MSFVRHALSRLRNTLGSRTPNLHGSRLPALCRPGLESLEDRLALSASPLPVLMVLPSIDFHYMDYSAPRQALEGAGVPVRVASTTTALCRPHYGTGQGADGGLVRPDLALADVDATQFSAVLFVGGWGASSYQYAFSGTYACAPYNGSVATRDTVNRLVNDFVDQDKYVTGICFGVSALAWARVDGASPLAGRTVSAYAGGAPASNVAGATTTRWHVEANGATMVPSGSIGDPRTVADDVFVDGKVITAEDWRAGRRLGEVIAQKLFLPTVSVVATDAAASEAGADLAVFTVSRGAADRLDQDLTVHYTVGGSATAGSDYFALSGSVVIPAGAVSAAVTVTPMQDATVEGAETVTLTLQPGAAYTTVALTSASATISDDDRLPVLMVIANVDFFYQEYADTRFSLEQAGLTVQVAAAAETVCRPHWNSGQGADGGLVMPDLAVFEADAANYSAVVFVGGWGSSSYQYAFAGTYANAAYNGTDVVQEAVNRLINDFVDQDKYVTAICHGVSVLAYARVDGGGLLDGRTVSAYGGSAPQRTDAGTYQNTTRWHVESNGGTMVRSHSVGDGRTAADDVIVDGKIITAENYDSALLFGQVIAEHVLA